MSTLSPAPASTKFLRKREPRSLRHQQVVPSFQFRALYFPLSKQEAAAGLPNPAPQQRLPLTTGALTGRRRNINLFISEDNTMLRVGHIKNEPTTVTASQHMGCTTRRAPPQLLPTPPLPRLRVANRHSVRGNRVDFRPFWRPFEQKRRYFLSRPNFTPNAFYYPKPIPTPRDTMAQQTISPMATRTHLDEHDRAISYVQPPSPLRQDGTPYHSAYMATWMNLGGNGVAIPCV